MCTDGVPYDFCCFALFFHWPFADAPDKPGDPDGSGKRYKFNHPHYRLNIFFHLATPIIFILIIKISIYLVIIVQGERVIEADNDLSAKLGQAVISYTKLILQQEI
ncbi:MAG: hypothetical protein WDM70_08460 [Nitrosomonadales bacterium]